MIGTAEARRTSESLVTELEDLIQSASDLLENLNEQRGDAVEGLRTRATRNIDSARRRIADMKPEVHRRARHATHAASEFARSNPWSTAAIGTAIAASLGALLYMSLSDRR
jgi:ElaB/YqjD/DUF883 family membrane-anchored ribosome-binding protein